MPKPTPDEVLHNGREYNNIRGGIMTKNCVTCGKERLLPSWARECALCDRARKQRETTTQIARGEATETDCESEIYCPHCGEVMDIDDHCDLYDDGEHDEICPSCEKEFVVNTYVSYSFSTRRQEAIT